MARTAAPSLASGGLTKAETQAGSLCLKYAYIRVFNIANTGVEDPDGREAPEVTQPSLADALNEMKACKDRAEAEKVWKKHKVYQKTSAFIEAAKAVSK